MIWNHHVYVLVAVVDLSRLFVFLLVVFLVGFWLLILTLFMAYVGYLHLWGLGRDGVLPHATIVD